MAKPIDYKQELSLLKAAMRLNRFDHVQPIDIKAALETTTEKTKFNQPLVKCFVVEKSFNTVVEGYFTPTGSSLGKKPVQGDPFYPDRLSALMACRYMLARASAERLVKLDATIDKLFNETIVWQLQPDEPACSTSSNDSSATPGTAPSGETSQPTADTVQQNAGTSATSVTASGSAVPAKAKSPLKKTAPASVKSEPSSSAKRPAKKKPMSAAEAKRIADKHDKKAKTNEG